MTITRTFECYKTYVDLCEEILKDIRNLFMFDQIRPDGQIKRNPKWFTPWSARNFKYNKSDKYRMMYLVNRVAFLNDKNIWQFYNTDIRVISSTMREEARKWDEMANNI